MIILAHLITQHIKYNNHIRFFLVEMVLAFEIHN
jgi:hypothetical protein